MNRLNQKEITKSLSNVSNRGVNHVQISLTALQLVMRHVCSISHLHHDFEIELLPTQQSPLPSNICLLSVHNTSTPSTHLPAPYSIVLHSKPHTTYHEACLISPETFQLARKHSRVLQSQSQSYKSSTNPPPSTDLVASSR